MSIRIGNEAVDGFLSFTSERLLFRKEDDAKEESTWKMFQIYFKSVCVHAIESLVVHTSSEEEEEEKEEKKVGEKCLYLQVDGELDPLIVRNERDEATTTRKTTRSRNRRRKYEFFH